jgi:SAM-dependent methyltransferase
MVIPNSAITTSRCFLCNTASDRVVWLENGFQGKRCGCGMVYTETEGRPLESFIDFTEEVHQETFYSLPAKLKAKWMAAHCPFGRLLEVGCGDGFFLAAARGLGYEVVGMEPHRGRAERVSRGSGVPMELAFIEDDSLPATSFDVVYHCDLLAHFPDPARALRSMTRLLRPGGVLCFEVGILGGISPLWYGLIGGIGLGRHLWLYSYRALATLLERSGLSVEHQQHFGLGLGVLLDRPVGIVTNRLLRPILLGLRLSGAPTGPEKAVQFKRVIENFLRYGAGRFSPRFGPATMWIVARPKGVDRGTP